MFNLKSYSPVISVGQRHHGLEIRVIIKIATQEPLTVAFHGIKQKEIPKWPTQKKNYVFQNCQKMHLFKKVKLIQGHDILFAIMHFVCKN